jgi:BirA family biotin operon repressor/biotin-[acetyl-CoA-carboxylase] ligase
MKNGYIKLLSIISDGKIHSGEMLATHLNISRAAIWKLVKYLQALGLEIEAIRGKGYLLHNNFEFLSKEDIRDMISPRAKKSCRTCLCWLD